MKNNIKKGMTMYILTAKAFGDSSNGGISSKVNRVTVIGKDIPEIFEPSEDAPAVQLVYRSIGGEKYIHAEPVKPVDSGHVGYMFGGCYIESSDGRMREISKYPIPLHDRSETPEQYDFLSR